MLTFGVVICTYNRPDLIIQCLESWQKSNRLPNQFIVVDATHNAGEYRQKLLSKFPKLFSDSRSLYLTTDTPGLTKQRNLGLKHIETDIVCFADDDAFVTPDYSTKILEVFELDRQKQVGGVCGVATGHFDRPSRKYFRIARNTVRNQFGWVAQRIRVPKRLTKVYEPFPAQLRNLPLIHVNRLWGANMNFRTNLVKDLGFDRDFQRYGLFEDVDLSVRVGQTHQLIRRIDAEVVHDSSLGQTTRPNEAKYFLLSWVNSAYIIEKIFPCEESRNAHRRLFFLLNLIYKFRSSQYCERKFSTYGNEELQCKALQYIDLIQNCSDLEELSHTFTRLQEEIFSM